MSQTNRIKLISRNWESQRLCDPFNSHPCYPLNAAAPSFLSFFFFPQLYNRAPFYFLFKCSCLFNGPACASVHAGDNTFMSCSQSDWKVVGVPTRKTLEWIFSLPLLPDQLIVVVVVVVLFLLSGLPVTIVEDCDCCAAVQPLTVCHPPQHTPPLHPIMCRRCMPSCLWMPCCR